MGEKVCIECGNPVYGKKAIKVKDDLVLKFIRKIKRVTKTAKENELYVCEDDLAKNQQKRKEFIKSMLLFGVAAAIVFLLSLIVIFVKGQFDLSVFAFGVITAVAILTLTILAKYTPGVESGEPVLIEQRPTEGERSAAPTPAPSTVSTTKEVRTPKKETAKVETAKETETKKTSEKKEAAAVESNKKQAKGKKRGGVKWQKK